MNYVLTEQTAGRLKRLLNSPEGAAGGVQRRPVQRTVSLVRCTSEAAAGGSGAAAQCYRAEMIVDAATDTAPEVDPDSPLPACWLTVWGDDDLPTVPTEGRIYIAVFSGELAIGDDRLQRAFGVPVGNDSVPRVFPVELTGAYNASTGYPWKRLSLTSPNFVDASPSETGQYAFTLDDDQTLESGAQGVLVETPDGWALIHTPGFGCGFVYDPDTDSWATDTALLVGDQADTSLITITSESCDIFSFDRVSNYRTDETLVNNVRIEKSGDKIKLTQTKTDYTNWFNIAGVLTDRTAGAPYDETSEVDVCEETCCGATLLEVSVSVTDNGDCSFTFDSTVTGGSASFVYEWTFGDTGTSAVADPTHAYEFGGTYTVTLVVTDACGQRATWTDTVTCDNPIDACSAYTVDATDALYRGVGDSWTGGTYTLTKDGNNWTLISSADGSSDFCSWIVEWDGAGCATFALSETGGGATCAASVEVCCGATVPDEGCCADVPTILYVTFSGASAPWDVLNGITVQLDYYASIADVPFGATVTGYGCTGYDDPAWWGTLPTPVDAGGGDTLYYARLNCNTGGGAAGDYSFNLLGSTGATCAVSGWTRNDPGGYTETCSPFEVVIDHTDAGQPLVTVTE